MQQRNRCIGQYVNGNYGVGMFEDGTKVRQTKDDEFIPSIPESMDVTITENCSVGCQFCYLGCTKEGKHGDLSYDFLNHLNPYTEMAINGNDMNHPDLIPFLEKLKEQKVFANITLNQVQFEKNIDLLKKLRDDKLIWGIGVSLTNATLKLAVELSEFPNAVIHTINGLLTSNDVKILGDKGLKVLVLGYKHKGRGDEFYEKNKERIDANQKWLDENLAEVTKKFEVFSFDNLSIEQLPSVREVVGDDWDEFYMGDDGMYTFFIDLVHGTFAKNSTIKECFPIEGRSVNEMFNFIRERYGK